MASGTSLGLVIYTGRETRATMNASQARSKVCVCFRFFDFFITNLFLGWSARLRSEQFNENTILHCYYLGFRHDLLEGKLLLERFFLIFMIIDHWYHFLGIRWPLVSTFISFYSIIFVHYSTKVRYFIGILFFTVDGEKFLILI